jgi:hypothetical protein
MKEYNMEASTERCAGRFQIVSKTSIGFYGRKQVQPVAHRKPSGVSEGFRNVRRKQQERRLSISDRYADQLEFPNIPKEGRKGIIGIDIGSLVLDRCSRRCR